MVVDTHFQVSPEMLNWFLGSLGPGGAAAICLGTEVLGLPSFGRHRGTGGSYWSQRAAGSLERHFVSPFLFSSSLVTSLNPLYHNSTHVGPWGAGMLRRAMICPWPDGLKFDYAPYMYDSLMPLTERDLEVCNLDGMQGVRWAVRGWGVRSVSTLVLVSTPKHCW